MADELDGKKLMKCEDAIEINELVKQHRKVYRSIIMDHAKVREGKVFACCHTKDFIQNISKFQEELDNLKKLMAGHVHVTEEKEIIDLQNTEDAATREPKGRAPATLKPGQVKDQRDSAYDSTTSQILGATQSTELKISDRISAEMPLMRMQESKNKGSMEAACNEKKKNRIGMIRDPTIDNRFSDGSDSQNEQEYSHLHKKFQTLPKTEYSNEGSDAQGAKYKNDSIEKEKDTKGSDS